MPRGGIITLALALAGTASARADDEALKHALALEESIQKIVERAEGSVACILVSRSDAYARVNNQLSHDPGKLGGFNPPPDPGPRFGGNPSIDPELVKRLNLAATDVVPDSYGSGVVIDARKGLVLTNLHVIRDATKVFIRLPGKQGSYANILAADERSDLAVLELLTPPPNLKALPMGEADKMKKGQFVLAIANPYAAGFRDGSPSVSWGLLSNVRRRLPGEPNDNGPRKPRLAYYPVLFQTDIRMPPGCSGGALLDLHGNWIGLTTSLPGVVGGEGTGGFAVPLDTRMKRIIDRLRQGLEVEYGFLGISQDFRSAGEWNPTPGGPAARAGMQTGDRIISIEGEPINELEDMLLNISVSLAGTEIRMTVESRYGNGQRRQLRPVLAKASWPATGPVIAANRPAAVHGLRVDYTSVVYQPGFQNRDKGLPPGVLVREVQENSPAAKALELKPDSTIIVAVNGRAVNTPKEFYEAAREAGGSVELTLLENGAKVKLP